MALKVIVAVTFLLLCTIVYVDSQPGRFNYKRSHTFNAAPEQIIPYITDLRRWNEWSPWAKLDPHVKIEYSGADTGKDASFSWDGNSKVGKGSMTITDVQETTVTVRLDFLKPFKATNTTVFELQPTDGGTAMTWSMAGENNFISKAMGIVIDCEKMIGDMFEQGFQNLEAVLAR